MGFLTAYWSENINTLLNQQVSPIYQRFYDLKQFFVNKSALFSEEAILTESQNLKAKEKLSQLVSGVTDSVTDTILAAYESYDVTLDSPIGYTVGYSVRSGDSFQFYISNLERTSVAVYRLGRAKIKVETLDTLSPNRQSPSFSPFRGFDWNPTLALDTAGYRSGYYLIELIGLDSGNQYQIPFFVTPSKSPRIAVVAQTNTWHAYNSYGGLAYYTDKRSRIYQDEEVKEYNTALKAQFPHDVHLPYARPYSYRLGNPDISQLSIEFQPPVNIPDDMRPEDSFDSHLFRSEWNLVAFLEEHQLDYGVYTDVDFKIGGSILESDVIIFNTHNEYWSEEMLKALRQYIEDGGKVLFAGGNSAFRGVKHTEYGMRVIQDKIPSYISAPLLGTSYTGDGFRTYGSYKVTNGEHWVFDATGVRNNDEIGVYSANKPRPGSQGEGGVGASGWETDKVNRSSDLFSEGFETLAIGTNSTGPAFMVFKETDAGGWVFNAASIAFTGALLHDPVIDKMMLNLLTPK